MKISELTGHALDWAVAKCEGDDYCDHDGVDGIGNSFDATSYSSNWAQGGPIIERELLDLHSSSGGDWTAEKWEYEVTSGGGTNTYIAFGPTPLVAAMRAFVASKLGDEVEVPDELS